MKKPSASVSLYLRSAALNQVGKVEQLPATKQNWAEYERLRLLVWRLRNKSAGFAWWVPVLVALALCLLFILWLASQVGRSESYLYPYHYWRVVQNLSPCQPDGSCGDKYLIQEVNDGVANPPTEVHFRGAQHFENGHTFSWLKGRWIGTEFAIEGWDVVHGPDGRATLAPNCYADYSQAVAGHIVCEGGKARF